jgi:chromosome segregation ATPase
MSGLVDTLLSAGIGGGIATGWMLVAKWRDGRAKRAEKREERVEARDVAEVTERHAVIKADIAATPEVLKSILARLERVEAAHTSCEERSDRAEARIAHLEAELATERRERAAAERRLAVVRTELEDLRRQTLG